LSCGAQRSDDAPPDDVGDSPEATDQTTADVLHFGSGRTIVAHVVALDQVYVYNRFGAFNPDGMIFALERDVVPIDPSEPIGPGNAMLRLDKRPRPLVLRVNVGDKLVVYFKNLLAPTREDTPPPRDVPFHVPLPADPESDPDADSTATRKASFHVAGLQLLDQTSQAINVGNNAPTLAAPGETRTYRFYADHEGTFLAHSGAAMTGGEGLGGQIVLGLFAAVNVEPRGAVWYRSQLTRKDFLAVATFDHGPLEPPSIDYDATYPDGTPILRILDDRYRENEIVHSDLNAIITDYAYTEADTTIAIDQGYFREMTVVFHDELRAVQAFDELNEPSFQGVRDGFGINYGAAGLGAELLANRKQIGPTKKCAECKFEEFFLSSWAGGDPAIVLDRDADGHAVEALYPDDPSNVHHTYLGDPVRIRNLHAGPKETHIFHMHAHQWVQSPASDDAMYRDSQTIGPGAAFTYNLAFGGSGNRVLTPGDAIFHCHLYPHFAQGMWELFRVHDVFEDGSNRRRLPDGEIANGTPTPALVPIPERGMAPLPTYRPTVIKGHRGTRPAMPGYPFYVAALAGHRPPQPPLDMVFDGGLPRHRVEYVPPNAILRGTTEGTQFDVTILAADLQILPQAGTATEKMAMDFHAGAFPGGKPDTTLHGWKGASYPTRTPLGAPARFFVNGNSPKQGAPYADPCPKDVPRRNIHTAYMQIDGTLNDKGWHDPQLRLTVLEEDVEATRNGSRPPEPLFFRANSNDCIQYEATNLIPKVLTEDAFQISTPTDTIGQHIHLVQFDVTSADGSANGWNYEDGTFAAGEVIERIQAANAEGGAIAPNGTRVILTPKQHPRIRDAYGAQTTAQRWWASPILNARGEDRTIRTVFTHDHFSPSSHQQHGLYGALVIEPRGSKYQDSITGYPLGTRPDGGPTSFRANILPPNGANYREFNLAFADFTIAYDQFLNPVNPPGRVEAPLPLAVLHVPAPPEVISAADTGTMVINYRNEPIPLRIANRNADGSFEQKPGEEGAIENVFRSDLHGDPSTPLLQAYAGDPVQIRLITGAQEEQHVFSLHGNKWLYEFADPNSGYSNADPLGLSEHLEFVMPERTWSTNNEEGFSDYLYESTPTDDQWNGMWGLMRCYGTKDADLAPLPGSPWAQVPTGCGLHGCDEPYEDPPQVCPPDAPVREYSVVAITAKDHVYGGRITYNEAFDLYDSNGILFTREEYLPELLSGARKPEPLVLRAAAGECIHVTLHNLLPEELPQAPNWNYYPPITEGFNANQVRRSSHVSLHPQLVAYDVNESDGANVGGNAVQTVAPGEHRTYVWYAGEWRGDRAVPIEFGAINLRDMADVVHGGPHGGIAALIIEPPDATFKVDPKTDAQATISSPGHTPFRELVLLMQDDVPLESGRPKFQCGDDSLNCGTAIRNIGAADDAEDSGHDAFNYRTEPIWARLGLAPQDTAEINGRQLGNIHLGNPATPILRARVGQAVRIRRLQPSGHPRQHAFTLGGAEWRLRPFIEQSQLIGENPFSMVIGGQGGLSTQTAENILPLHGAGGKFGVAGDYLYRDQASFGYTDGMWGLLRVTNH